MLDLLKGLRDVGMRGAAIFPPLAPSNRARDKYLASDWHRILSAFLEESSRRARTDAEVTLQEERFGDATNAIWAKPVRTWDDLIVRAAIAMHWNEPLDPGDPAYPDDIISGNPEERFDARALAHVVRGVLDLAGLKFDAEGRCIARERS